MRTTRDDISRWFDRGIAQEAHWMIVVCDTYDHGDYPVFAETVEEFRREYAAHNGKNMQKIMEVYDLRMDKESQLNEHRAFHGPQKDEAPRNESRQNEERTHMDKVLLKDIVIPAGTRFSDAPTKTERAKSALFVQANIGLTNDTCGYFTYPLADDADKLKEWFGDAREG